jgi:chemotaxis protein methyltransferase WspC
MNLVAVETWLQSFAGLEASTLGAGAVARAARLRLEATGCTSAKDYIALLEASAEERHALIDRVIVPETWFFRDRPALDAVARHVVQTWGPAHPGAIFRVLSIPCSTGEEPYSLAMALAIAGWALGSLRIDAVDISRENLERARRGVYGRNSFRGEDLKFRDSFLEPVDAETWRVADRLRAPVRFEHGNLLHDDFSVGRLPYDAIFCRNLLIYFDRPTQARAIRTLDRLLVAEGWFAVGPAEPALLFEHGYEALKVRSAFLLRRAPPAGVPPPPLPKRADAAPTWPKFSPPAPAKPPAPPIVPPPAPSLQPAPPSQAAPTLPAEASDPLDEMERLADAGRLREASTLGEFVLARQGASPRLLFLLAVVAQASGQNGRAETLFRKTLYLDPQHGEALAHLALLAEKSGDLRGARAYRERAQRAQVNDTR